MRSELMEEYNALRERCERAERGMQIHDILQLKLSVRQAREFLNRWQDKGRELSMERKLAELRDKNQRMMAVLESWFLEALHRVIDKRIGWLIAEHCFRFSVEYIQMMQTAPRDLQEQLGVFFLDEFGYEFRAERLFRQSEATADRCERDYKNAMSALEADWPDRLSAELRSRLAAIEPRQLRRWKATLPMPSLNRFKPTL
jgi:hypothetical protein